jgi:hypothetical protein
MGNKWPRRVIKLTTYRLVAEDWSGRSSTSGGSGGDAVAAWPLRVEFRRGEEECGATSDCSNFKGS